MRYKPQCAGFGDLYVEPSRNGLTKPSKLRGHGVKLVNMGEIFTHDRLSVPNCDRAPCTEKEFSSSLLRPKDLLFARQSLVLSGAGKCSLFIGDSEPVVFESHIIRVRLDQDRVAPEYYYLFRSSKGRALIASIVEQGAGASGIRGSDLAELIVPTPPLEEQRTIARILGTLDDKIELNHRSNETLKAMARALFKDWFVDFGPVRVKHEGRAAYLSSELWSLFPDALDNGSPAGWRISHIGNEIVVVGGSTPSTKESMFWEGGANRWATPKDLSRLTTPVLLDTERKITDAAVARISSGLLPIGTVLLSSRAPIGYLAIAEVPTAINQGFIAMICDRELPNLYVLHWCRENMSSILGNPNGSTFQEISKSNFRPIAVVVPPKPVMEAFMVTASPLYQRMASNTRENESLATLRDTLLPMLLSGELRVRDAERLFS